MHFPIRPILLSCFAVAGVSGAASAQIASKLQTPAAKAVVDHVTGDLLRASSVPKLGRLYPLSQSWFVEPGGYVGINTTSPGTQLDVEGTFSSGRNHDTEQFGSDAAALGGYGNTASGSRSVVVGGSFSDASGFNAVSVGGNANSASGSNSVAIGGVGNEATGTYAVASGRFAHALHDFSFVFAGGSAAGMTTTAPSQFLISAPGGVGIGTNAPATALHVAGGSDASLAGGGYLQTGNTNGANIAMDENEIMARSNGGPSALYLNHEGGNVLIGAASTYRVGIGTTNPADRLHVVGNVRCTNLIETSDARLKEDITDLEHALEAVLALRGVAYSWKEGVHREQDPGRHLGFLAQEVREVLPDAVHESEDGTLGVDYSAIVPVLVEALQSQEERLSALEQAVRELR